MKHLKVTRLSYLLVIVLATFVLGGGTVNAMTPRSCGAWIVVNSPNAGLIDAFNAVAAVPGTKQYWAVGYFINKKGYSQTLSEHWDGANWSVVSSPNPKETSENTLNGITVVSANDVWAVGQAHYFGNPSQTLIEHWNGSQWSVVPSPNASQQNNVLNAVAAVSTNDVWAVGYDYNARLSQQSLVEHWNGTSWSIVSNPGPTGSDNILNAITVVSANDVWTVGSFYNSSQNQTQTLIKHWNGTSWGIVSSPNVGKGYTHDNHLNGVAMVSANDIWAVGYYEGGKYGEQTLIQHWDGSSWSIVTSPQPVGDERNLGLYAVATDSTSDVWAVGYANNSNGAEISLVVHWNGSKWSIVPSPNPGGTNYDQFSPLYGVALLSAHDVQAVGFYYNFYVPPTYPDRTLVESYC